jgi:hypothetical protein
MNRITNKTVSVTQVGSAIGSDLMSSLVNALARSGILKADFDYSTFPSSASSTVDR